MESVMLYLVALFGCCVFLAEAAPLANYETPQRQACGDKLADIMSLVCSGRGYNVPFRPEHGGTSRRFRRQIVDECCRRSCNPAMLELYCRAEPTDAPTNSPIRKRSDNDLESIKVQQAVDDTKLSTEQSHLLAKNTPKPITEKEESATNNLSKKGKETFKLVNLLESSERSVHKQSTKNNKSTYNDTTEEEVYKPSRFPSLRHHNRHHSRLFRARKHFGKTKREKNVSDESKQTFQIGTMKPYFSGRALASYRSNYIHHLPHNHP